MASIPARIFDRNAPLSLSFAFIERQTNLWKRYWGWELVWLVYGLVNTLAVTLIAEQLGRQGAADPDVARRLVLFLLIGTLVWAYLSAVLDDISLVVQWERWEGTIEHTLMAPVPRVLHLLGMSVFGVLHGAIRTMLIFGIALFSSTSTSRKPTGWRRARSPSSAASASPRSPCSPACCRSSIRSAARK